MKPEIVAKGMEEIRRVCKNYLLENRYNIDETGVQWQTIPTRTYLSTHKNRKTVRGTKDMNFKDRVSAFHVHERLWHGKGGDDDHRQGEQPARDSLQSLPSQVLLAGQRVV